MDRILCGRPERSNGALTIVAFAVEAGVPRNALTQRHLDLKNEFYAKVKERGQPTDAETRLRKHVVRLKELRKKDRAEQQQLRADVEGIVRVVNQLTLEDRQLRDHLSTPDPVVRVFPVQHTPPKPRLTGMPAQGTDQSRHLEGLDVSPSRRLRYGVAQPAMGRLGESHGAVAVMRQMSESDVSVVTRCTWEPGHRLPFGFLVGLLAAALAVRLAGPRT
ncbi:hypothetical protein [Streptomyces luteolifulvus]|uniref:hypothetical protein n=1 Tax=Streptomyces luteolifulvus TaxID=2615112 RepID=UPI00177B01E6|nr:hypothetical protein [Streptomyces luteolifulvus]